MTSPALKAKFSHFFLLTVLVLGTFNNAFCQLKSWPKGVYCLLPFQDGSQPDSVMVKNLVKDTTWTMSSALVTGMAVRVAWSVVEPSNGVYDYTVFDQAVALGQQYGKKVSLSITAGTFTPQWVYSAGAQQFNFTLSTGQAQIMPLPWDPVFQAKWFALIQQLGKRYDGNAVVSYVAMGGVGRQMETYFVQVPLDITEFDATNGQELWLNATEANAWTFAQAFPRTQILYAIAPPSPDPTGSTTMTQMIGSGVSAFPIHFGIRSDGLRPLYDVNGTVGQLLLQYAGQATTGFQMSAPAVNQSLSLWFSVAVQMKADFVEVYETNVQDPSQATALATWNLHCATIVSSSP